MQIGIGISPSISQFLANSEVDWSLYDATHNTPPANFNGTAIGRGAAAVNIDEGRVLVAYRNATTNLRAVIVSVDESGSVSIGTSALIWTGGVTTSVGNRQLDLTLLSDTRALVVWGSSGGINAAAFDFSGATIGSVGTAVEIADSAGFPRGIAVAGLSSTTAIFSVFYNGTLTLETAVISIASDRTVTIDTAIPVVTVSNFNIDSSRLVALSATKAVLLTADNHTVSVERPFAYAHLVTVSGTTPTVADSLQLSAAIDATNIISTTSLSLTKISSTQCLAIWGITADTVAVVITESGGTLSKGTQVEFDGSRTAQYTYSCLQDDTHAFVGYTDGTAGANLRSGVIEINGSALTPLTTYENSTANVDIPCVAKARQAYSLFLYMDDDDNDQTKYIVATPE